MLQAQGVPGLFAAVGAGSSSISAELQGDIPLNYGQICATLPLPDCPIASHPSAFGSGFVTPTISWNGGNLITNTTQNAVVGQQILLAGNSGGGHWSIGGQAVAGFNAGFSGGPYTLIHSTGTNVLFYWIVPGTNTVTYTVGGVSASVTFNVVGPTNPNVVAIGGSVEITSGSPPLLQLGNRPFLPLGITFSGTATPPSGYTGQFEFVQIINAVTQGLYYPNGQTSQCTGSGLDLTYPYPFSNGGGPNPQTNDSPSLALASSVYTRESRMDSFSMYFLWRPDLPNSIFVPLGMVNWSWSGDATYNAASGSWTLLSSSSPGNPAFSPSSTYPSWSSTYSGNPTCTPLH